VPSGAATISSALYVRGITRRRRPLTGPGSVRGRCRCPWRPL
jgi:hypothetical protein